MIKFWAKVIKDDKLIKSVIFEEFSLLNRENFEKSVAKLCETIDEPCPVLLSKHYNHFNEFNITHFSRSDFIEKVDFDKLVIENALKD